MAVTSRFRMAGHSWVFDEGSDKEWGYLLADRQYLGSGFNNLCAAFAAAQPPPGYESYVYLLHCWVLVGHRVAILEFLKSSWHVSTAEKVILQEMVWRQTYGRTKLLVHALRMAAPVSLVRAYTGPQAWKGKAKLQRLIKRHKELIESLVIDIWFAKVGAEWQVFTDIVSADIPVTQTGPSFSTASSAAPIDVPVVASSFSTASSQGSQRPGQR